MKILFGTHKGGEGKSTLATNFAVLLAESGRDVLLIDCDPTASTTLWAAVRAQLGQHPAVTCMSIYGDGVRHEIERMVPRFDDLVIDTAGRDSKEMRMAMLSADVMVTPINISLFSTATLGRMRSMITEGRIYNPLLKCYLVPNRVHANAGRGSTQLLRLRAACEDIDEYIVTDKYLRERAAFCDILESGRGVSESQDEKAAAEIRAVFKEICDVV